MRILLINPPFFRLKGLSNIYLPLGLSYLAAFIDNKLHTVKLYNVENPSQAEYKDKYNIEKLIDRDELYIKNLFSDDFHVWNEVKSVISDFKPDLVGISVMTAKYASAQKITKIIKQLNPNVKIVWGGPHVSADGLTVMKENHQIDFAIYGEGESAFNNLVFAIENESDLSNIGSLIYRNDNDVICTNPEEFINNLDNLPFPLRDADVFQDRYGKYELGNIMTSRGCPYQCTFCNSFKVWGHKTRFRSVDNILNEIDNIINKFNIRSFHFSDDTFTLNKKHVFEFCSGLKERNINISWSCTTRLDVLDEDIIIAMKKSGLSVVTVGVESGSDKILKLIKKGLDKEEIRRGIDLLNKFKIDWHAFFMIGFPFEEEADILETRKFIRELNPTRVELSIFTPYPGSELFEEAKSLGVIDDNIDWTLYSHQSSRNYFVKNISKERFSEIVNDMFSETERINKSYWNYFRKFLRRKNDVIYNIGKYIKNG